jgi:Txe/YoeB family toxin of Txe-Axe toxin-antitoxin module
MEVEYKSKALEDREFWKQSGNLKVQHKISELRIKRIIGK